jgi:hypothetical protein
MLGKFPMRPRARFHDGNHSGSEARTFLETRDAANVKSKEGNDYLDALTDAVERFERAASKVEPK